MRKQAWLSWLVGLVSCAGLGCREDRHVTVPTFVGGATPTAGKGAMAAGGTGFGGTPTIVPAGGVGPTEPLPTFDFGASCDEGREIARIEPALIVREPEVLKEFSLERVLSELIRAAQADVTPLELLQRMFDSENTEADGVFSDNPHCDSTDNAAFLFEPATYCPRAEGRLARSEGLLTPGHPDFFEPVALVNRFDLLPSDASICGEYHVVYAKHSGLTDPQDRVLLSFDARLMNSSHQFARCRPVVELWAGLEELDGPGRRDALAQLFFEGIDSLPPVLTPSSLGGADVRCEQLGRCGQIRVAQGMQEPFEFRQFRIATEWHLEQPTKLWIAPSPNSGSMRPSLFDWSPENGAGIAFRDSLRSSVGTLSGHDLNRISFFFSGSSEAGETAVEGPASPNYRERLTSGSEPQLISFDDSLLPALASVGLDCPTDDPLSPLSLVERTAALSCAGCHAPDRVLHDERKLGCGDVWPPSLGVSHIDERGNLSAALTETFLPYRKQVLTTFYRACDGAAAAAHVQPVQTAPLLK